MSEQAQKALADMDRAIRILERLTAPGRAEARSVGVEKPKRIVVAQEARERV